MGLCLLVGLWVTLRPHHGLNDGFAEEESPSLLTLERTVETGRAGVRTLAVDPTGRWFVTGMLDGMLELRNVSDGALIASQRGDLGGFG